MQELKTSLPETWRELQDGNISVTKSEIPFCLHWRRLNRMMKIQSALISISNNANARQRLFLATSEMSQSLKGNLVSVLINHKYTMRYNQVLSWKSMTLSTRSRLPYWVTGIPLMQNMISFATSWHMHMLPKRVSHKIWMSTTVARNYEGINENVSLWAYVKKQNNSMFLSGSKEQSVDLKETKELYGRLVYGSSQMEPGHLSEECNRELRVYSDSQGIVCPRWMHPSMYRQVEAHTLPGKAEKTQCNPWECTSTSIWGTCWWKCNIFSTL